MLDVVVLVLGVPLLLMTLLLVLGRFEASVTPETPAPGESGTARAVEPVEPGGGDDAVDLPADAPSSTSSRAA